MKCCEYGPRCFHLKAGSWVYLQILDQGGKASRMTKSSFFICLGSYFDFSNNFIRDTKFTLTLSNLSIQAKKIDTITLAYFGHKVNRNIK